jgi:hypothetical protein
MLRAYHVLHIKLSFLTIFAGRALTYKAAINRYVANDVDLRKFELSNTDWETITLVTGWLKSFREGTTQMSATKTPMLSQTQAVFKGLQDDLRETIRTLPFGVEPALRDGLVAAHTKLSDYYTKFDESSYHAWAGRRS